MYLQSNEKNGGEAVTFREKRNDISQHWFFISRQRDSSFASDSRKRKWKTALRRLHCMNAASFPLTCTGYGQCRKSLIQAEPFLFL